MTQATVAARVTGAGRVRYDEAQYEKSVLLHHVPDVLNQDVMFHAERYKTSDQIRHAVLQLLESHQVWGPSDFQPMDIGAVKGNKKGKGKMGETCGKKGDKKEKDKAWKDRNQNKDWKDWNQQKDDKGWKPNTKGDKSSKKSEKGKAKSSSSMGKGKGSPTSRDGGCFTFGAHGRLARDCPKRVWATGDETLSAASDSTTNTSNKIATV